MLRYAPIVALLLLSACRDTSESGQLRDRVEALQEQALQDDTAWRLLESLTTEVGPRMAGTEGDAKAVDWAVENMRALGFDRVWLEHVDFPLWFRHAESGHVATPQRVELDLTALGGSPGTGGPLVGEVVYFESLDALQAVADGSLDGRIPYIAGRMERHADASGYGKTVPQRSKGPFVAARKGAAALLIRSVGTDYQEASAPHTGNMSSSEPGDRVPSAALSHASADRLEELLAGGPSVTVSIDLDVGFEGRGVSRNVIGEFDGSGGSGHFVLIGGHLDSWDLGTGAVDDGAGVAITLSAASLVAGQAQRPEHGIRVVLFANEEQGIFGGKAYARAHAEELGLHILGSESDLGSGRIYRFSTRVNAGAEARIAELEQLLGPLGIPRHTGRVASGGADIGEMRKLGLPVIDLRNDASRYFDLHHTRNDVLQNVDPADLRFNVAAYATLLQWAASDGAPFGPVEPSE